MHSLCHHVPGEEGEEAYGEKVDELSWVWFETVEGGGHVYIY
jgi:hypothetical protein